MPWLLLQLIPWMFGKGCPFVVPCGVLAWVLNSNSIAGLRLGGGERNDGLGAPASGVVCKFTGFWWLIDGS